MEKSESPTGRIIVIGTGVPPNLLRELQAMGSFAVKHIALEMSEEQVRQRLDAVSLDFAKLERRVLAAEGLDRSLSFRALYGYAAPAAEATLRTAREVEPKKNDPWYRREAKGGKRNRRW